MLLKGPVFLVLRTRTPGKSNADDSWEIDPSWYWQRCFGRLLPPFDGCEVRQNASLETDDN
eukprot:scaffold13866_cov175-Amphora_coffeaeformis.AAC.6